MTIAATEREADSIADIFPRLTNELANATWECTPDYFTFEKLADATWFMSGSPESTDLAAAISQISQAAAKATYGLMETIQRGFVLNCALNTPLQMPDDLHVLDRGRYFREYSALLMNKLSFDFKSVLPERFAWGEPLLTGVRIEPEDFWRRTGPPLSVVERVLGFSALPTGWDGYGGVPVERQTIENALKVLNELYDRADDHDIALGQPIVGPTPEGSIQIEWDHPEAYVSVEISKRDEPLGLYAEPEDGVEREIDAASLDDVWAAITEAFSPPT